MSANIIIRTIFVNIKYHRFSEENKSSISEFLNTECALLVILNIFQDLIQDYEMNLIPDNLLSSFDDTQKNNFSKVSISLYLNFRLEIDLAVE